MSALGIKNAVNTVHEFATGSLSAEECFCMVLSLLGEEQTKLQFHNLVLRAGLSHNGLLWKQVDNIYTNYFATLTYETYTGLEVNPEEVESFGEKLDLELASALSVADFSSATAKVSSATDTAHFGSINVPTYASKIKTTQICETRSLKVSGKYAESSEELKVNGAINDRRHVQHQSDAPTLHDHSCGPREPAMSARTKPEGHASKRKKKKKKAQSQHHSHGPIHHIGNKPVIYWLRRDLRLYDNPALTAAFQSNASVILTFLWSEEEEAPLAAGGATKYWLHFALSELNRAVQQEYGNRIVFDKVQDSHREMLSLVSEVGAGCVVMNNLYEPCLAARDDKISASLQSRGGF